MIPDKTYMLQPRHHSLRKYNKRFIIDMDENRFIMFADRAVCDFIKKKHARARTYHMNE